MTLEQIDFLIEKIDRKIFDIEMEDLKVSNDIEINYMHFEAHIADVIPHKEYDSFCYISYYLINSDDDDTNHLLLIGQPYAAMYRHIGTNVHIEGALISDKNGNINEYFKLRFIKRL